MTCSNLKSEQINENLEIVMDNGEILNKDELVNILLENFPNTEEKDGVLYGEKEGKKYGIYFKNISYLGTPHPFFKKRIQTTLKIRINKTSYKHCFCNLVFPFSV